jgi:hypothetical protein
MAVTIFVWDMFKYHAGDGFSVGHASMHVHGEEGSIYISFWPCGVLHFINADIKAEKGLASWVSKPITTLNESAIIRWWSGIQHNPLLDYKHKTPIQVSGAALALAGNTYSILLNQCSTTVVKALMVGANLVQRAKILVWLGLNFGSIPYLPLHVVPTVTPQDVKKLVEAVF